MTTRGSQEAQPGGKDSKSGASRRLPLKIPTVSWSDLAETLGPILLVATIAILVTLHYVSPAPPHTLTMSSGPKGSNFETIAGRYQKILARSGIKLKIIESEGSLENLNRLSDPKAGVDIALVQSGITGTAEAADLVSLGSVFYQPLTIFYRSSKALVRLSELHSQRIAIGPEGSGTRFLALALLKANEIEPDGTTTLLSLEGEAAKAALSRREVEAIFLSGDSASPATIRDMLHAEGIRLFDFTQADAYVRRFPYLNKLSLPAGAFDLGEDLPPTPINMLAPTVELLAHSNLHPALCDLLIEAAYEVHGHASLLQAAGQFPTPSTNSHPISDEAARYYKTGNKSFAYRYLPFWLASLLNRTLVVLLPIVVVVIPGLRFLPQLYNWRVNGRIHRRYGELMALEREALGNPSQERRAELLDRLDEIEGSVITSKVPGSHADQLYILRQHIAFVRAKLCHAAQAAGGAPAHG
ncbi:MAG: TAXI family TRAP transporter solute-binding subunit [Steroidobacteraceae bacterium]